MFSQPPARLVLAVQLVSLGLSAAVLGLDLRFDLNDEQSQTLGRSLTMVLLLAGLASHLEAKKGIGRVWLIAGLGVFPPLFAACAGPFRQVLGYHLLVLGIHGFVLWNLAKHQQRSADQAATEPRDSDGGQAA